MAAFHPGDEARGVLERVQDGGASLGLDVPDGVGDGAAIVGRSGYGAERLRERRDDDAILRAQVTRERARGVPNEVDAPPHALAAVDEQRVGRGQRLRSHQVQRLRHVVFEHRECRCRQARHEAPEAILHRGLEDHARHFGLLDHLERFQQHHIARAPAERIGNLGGDFARLERVLVGPLDGPWRAFADLSRAGRRRPGSAPG